MLDDGLPCIPLLLRSGFNSLPSINSEPFMSAQHPAKFSKHSRLTPNCESAIGQNLIANPDCANTYRIQTALLVSLGNQDHLFI